MSTALLKWMIGVSSWCIPSFHQKQGQDEHQEKPNDGSEDEARKTRSQDLPDIQNQQACAA